MSPRARALTAVAVAAALVGVAVWAAGRLPRRWDVILVHVDPPLTEVPEATPRLDALVAAGSVRGGADEETLERLTDRLQAAGWRAMYPEPGPSLRETTDQALEAGLDPAGPAGPRLLVVRYRPTSVGELDREMARLIDGLAAARAGQETLYIVVQAHRQRVVVAGPRAAASRGAGSDLVGGLETLLRLR